MLEICERFNDLNFHDSKLISFSLHRDEQKIIDDICFELEMLIDARPGFYKYKKTKLILQDCRVVRIDLDLVGKRYCSDDIASAFCKFDSDLKKKLINDYYKYEEDALNKYLHFQITLIPPGGDIDIFAKNFKLVGS